MFRRFFSFFLYIRVFDFKEKICKVPRQEIKTYLKYGSLSKYQNYTISEVSFLDPLWKTILFYMGILLLNSALANIPCPLIDNYYFPFHTQPCNK